MAWSRADSNEVSIRKPFGHLELVKFVSRNWDIRIRLVQAGWPPALYTIADCDAATEEVGHADRFELFGLYLVGYAGKF